MRPGGPRPRLRGALGLLLALAALPAAAQVTPLASQALLYRTYDTYGANYLSADGGVIYTDNVQRTASGSGETLLMLGLSGTTANQGSHFDYRLSSNLALVKYLGGAFPTEPTGFLDGTLTGKIVPGFFSWIVRDTFSEVLIDPYAPVTPENLENLNLITTGPRFTLRPTLRTTVTLDALYSYLTSSSPSSQYINIDNHRYGGNLTIDRAFSETSSLYLKGHYEKVEFKDQVDNNNFSIGDASGGYHLTDGRTVFDVSGGYSQLRLYDVLTTVEGPGGSRETITNKEFEEPIWRIDLSRLITPTQRIALHASQQFTDATSAFRLGFDQAVAVIAPPRSVSSEPFKSRQYTLNWALQATRTVIGVSLTDLRQQYLIDTGNNSDLKLASVTASRLMSPVLTWDIGVSFERNEQTGIPPANSGEPVVTGQSAKIFGAQTDLRWQVGERLALRFIYAYSKQSGVYSDNQIGVTASWALLGAQATPVQSFRRLSPTSPASTMSPY
jgi:hypothetical protein